MCVSYKNLYLLGKRRLIIFFGETEFFLYRYVKTNNLIVFSYGMRVVFHIHHKHANHFSGFHVEFFFFVQSITFIPYTSLCLVMHYTRRLHFTMAVICARWFVHDYSIALLITFFLYHAF